MSLVREQIGLGYLIYAFFAALFMAVSSFLRSLTAATPYDSLFSYSLGMVICSSILLTMMRCRLKEGFHLPYLQKETQQSDSEGSGTESEESWKFSEYNFLLVVLAGLAELSIALTIFMAYS